jgi:DNA polymerase III alpha subunit
MDPSTYCELHAHSNFSFLDGASHPEDLVARAALLGMPALAITDHAGLYAAVRLWKAGRQTETDAARAAGLLPVRTVLGVELAVPRDERELRLARRGRRLNDPLRGARASRGWPGELHAGPAPGDHLVLLARDPEGYTTLSRLVSRAHLAGEKQFPVFDADLVAAALEDGRGHLIGLSGCRNGEVPRRLVAGERREAIAVARRWARHFPDGDFAIELSHHLAPDDDWLVAELASLAEETGLPTIVTNEVHYAEAGGHRLQDVLVCIRHGATLEEARELLLPNAEYRLKGGVELAAIGSRLTDARARRAWSAGMELAAAIGSDCRLEMDFERYRFPGFTVPEGETPFSYLYQRAHEGLRERYRPITKRALEQLTHELDVIDRTNLAEFFLIVWDLMEFARANGILGQGRGSAGDSIVAYCLGITKVDPIAHKLLFERFINEARALPDIDIDFDVNRREEVIQYLYTRYGTDHAAMVCNVITYRARSAVREVARALAFPAQAIDVIAKALDTRDATDVARDLALDGSFAWLFDELGVPMADLSLPSGRDGRARLGADEAVRTLPDAAAPSTSTAPSARDFVHPASDSSWNSRPRPALRPDLADAEARARDAAGDHDGRPYSESGWYPPRRPGVLDQSVVSVRHEGWQQKRYAGGGSPPGSALDLPAPRDNGSPGPWNDPPTVLDRRGSAGLGSAGLGSAGRGSAGLGSAGLGSAGVVRVDPESGMPVQQRRRPQVIRPGRSSREDGRMTTPGALSAESGADGAHSSQRTSINLRIQNPISPVTALSAPGVSVSREASASEHPDGASRLHAPPRNRWQWLLALCAEIDGFPRHLGIHVGGMLVTRTPLIDLAPIERAAMPGRVVTEFDKEDIEALGLVKIDLLSLRTLGVVSDALDRIARDTGTRPDLDQLPHDDPEVFATIAAADTVGMFQIESRAQMQALPKARPERFEDLVVQVAIIRPGPIQGNAVHPYLRRRAGTEPVTYLHESLRPILEDTLGVILYQEQVMQIAIAVCGYSATEADIFRKAMGSHRSHRKMQAERDRFVAGAMRTGLAEPDAEELFRRCSAFAEFGFARAHAAAFAKITYDTAWLKLHYPVHYLAGLLNNQPMGFYSPAVLIGDAKRHGVQVRPVDVNASRWEHEVERLPDGAFALRLGLRQVKGIDEAARELLEAERAIGAYRGVRDFVARTRLGEQVVERLIAIGAFDWTDTPRRELLWQLRTTMADADPQRPALGLTDDAQRELGASLPPMSFAERIAADYRELGLSPTAHAVELFRERLAARGVIPIAEAARRRDRSGLRLAGLAVSIQHPMTAKNFVFIALEDESGMINVTVRPQVYTAHRALLHRHPLLVIDGVLQVEGTVLNVVARRIRPVDAVVSQEARTTRLPLASQQRLFH